ncbi:hypothetical protein PSECIP111951_03335 [Pseudoalteromonas holothuriae]|uniref:Phytanoyl-CoA dioxygenase n=1 Tax=Pseudoalteromonas holothuriae TaxID=2963714 RepID=A0ABM9GM52_9GAMM|nr:phytanoyl-CoA dioxygenase family protein [Pseudoalteromonas sp. CIP111951]CAH9065330.1 hypothetical protein PSECIP111951_03335 [Pseudoalteromonas sp. CIP111951]
MTQTQQWYVDFHNQGYGVIKQALSASLLNQLQQLSLQVMENTTALADNEQQLERIAVGQYQGTRFVSRVNDLFLFAPQFIDLLAQPNIIQIAEHIIGEPVLPIYESLLVKHPWDNAFDWHRDVNTNTTDTILTVGVYLDDAYAEQGALKVLAGSHLNTKTVCNYKRDLTSGHIKAHHVDVKAAEVVFHHARTIHGSNKQKSDSQRRTIYFEFRGLSHIHNNPNFPKRWVEQRQALVDTVKNAAQERRYDQAIPSHFYDCKIIIDAAEYCFEPDCVADK